MNLRLRVLALVTVVTVAATGATAWLALRQASQQLTASTTADQQAVATMTDSLTDYGRRHGTWEGVASLVVDLHERTGERLRLTTGDGQVVADTDHLSGRTARETSVPPISIDPRPELELPPDVEAPARTVLTEIANYRHGLSLAACLTRAGAEVTMDDGPYGVPRHHPGPGTSRAQATECLRAAQEPPADSTADQEAVNGCYARDPADPDSPAGRQPPPTPERPAAELTGPAHVPGGAETHHPTLLLDCLEQAFVRRVAAAAPVPLRLHRGAVDEASPVPALAAGPVIAVAGLVAVLAVAGSLLLSRRVLRPIQALTDASRELGQGDLTRRVPEAGRDELAVLARSFNRMAESLQRGEELQRRLIADAAHELRTPLANLRGFLEALQDGVVPPTPELFASLHEEAVLQQRIVDDLQDLALAEAGSLAYHRSHLDLGELAESCRAAHQAVADAAGVRLVVATAGPVLVFADPDRLRQVLGNLVSNALRATSAGGEVALRVSRDGQWAVLAVADTGVGIAPEHLPHVFDRFWRADASRGRSTGGSGLGLAIARQIVTDHDGTITVTSEPGDGTTFAVRLPASAGSSEAG